MTKTTILAVCAAGLLSTAAFAQTAPPPPQGPTAIQCRDGYKDGMPWSRAEFLAACQKLQQNEAK
jgi:hypothetical protein